MCATAAATTATAVSAHLKYTPAQLVLSSVRYSSPSPSLSHHHPQHPQNLNMDITSIRDAGLCRIAVACTKLRKIDLSHGKNHEESIFNQCSIIDTGDDILTDIGIIALARNCPDLKGKQDDCGRI